MKTERDRRTDAVLERSEERLALALDAVGGGVFDRRYPTNECFRSDSWYELTGFGREELAAWEAEHGSIIHADDSAGRVEAFQRHSRGEAERYHCEFRIRHKSGEWRWLLGRGLIVERDADGSPLRMVGTDTDITARKRAEQMLRQARDELEERVEERTAALRESEARYSDLYDQSPDMYASVDARTAKIVQCNQTLAAAVGRSKDEIIGRPVFDLYHPDCMKDAERAFQAFVETGEVRNAELRLRERGGSAIDVSLNVSAVRDENGQILYSRSCWRDITERKRADKALKEMNVALANAMPGIARLDVDGRYVEVNDIYAGMMGFRRDEMIGSDWKPTVHPEDHAAAIQAYERMLLEGKGEFEARGVRKDATTFFKHVLMVKATDEHGASAGHHCFMRDITERKLAEDELRLTAQMTAEMAEGVNLIRACDGVIVYTNQRFDEMFGYDSGELTGKHATVLNAPGAKSPDQTAAEIIKGLNERGRWSGEIHNVKKNGTKFWCHVAVSTFQHAVHGAVWLTVQQDITERREAEDRQRLTQFAVDHSADPIYWVRADGGIAYANDAACQTLGYTRDEMTSMSVPEIDPDFPADAWPAHWLQMKEAGSIDFEAHHRTKSGRTIPVEIHTNFVEHGGQEYVWAYARDITERKRAEREATESRKRLQDILDAMFTFVGLFTTDGVVIETNRAPLEAANLKREDVIGKPFYETYWWSYSPEVQRQLRDALGRAAQGETVRYDVAVRVADDQLITIDVTFGPLYDADGKVVQLIGSAIDITDRKLAEEARRGVERQFRELIESAPDAIILTDAAGIMIVVNAQTEAIFGYARDELLGQPVEMLVPERFRARHIEQRQEYAANPRIRSMSAGLELIGLRKDGSEFPIDASLGPISTGDQQFVVSTVRDITEQKRAEDQLRQAQKMEAVGQLAGGIAHDFNNVLTVILTHVELLRSDLAAPPFETERILADLAEIERSGNRAADLTRQLLTFSRRQVISPRIIDVNELLSETRKMLDRLVREDIHIVVLPGRNLSAVRADPGQIEQVLMNLVVNARDAMPDGGTITIETANVPANADDLAQHPDRPSGPHVLLAVSDTGCGIDEQTRKRIFEPFFTTKAVGEGTGLGLATVHGIVKQAGGRIMVYSEPGRGTTFKVYLPAHGEAATTAERDGQAAESARGTETVLVCEDERPLRELTCRILEKAGYTVLSASHPKQALKTAEEFEGAIHLLVTDVIMPGMNGRALAERVCASRPDTRALYVSGYASNVIAHHGVLRQGVEFLEKPFNSRGLLKRVREVLDKQQGVAYAS